RLTSRSRLLGNHVSRTWSGLTASTPRHSPSAATADRARDLWRPAPTWAPLTGPAISRGQLHLAARRACFIAAFPRLRLSVPSSGLRPSGPPSAPPRRRPGAPHPASAGVAAHGLPSPSGLAVFGGRRLSARVLTARTCGLTGRPLISKFCGGCIRCAYTGSHEL